jgi:hypothetical protein
LSTASAGAVASASSSDNLSLGARTAGIVWRPRATFEAVAAAPSSATLLVLLGVVPFVISAAFFSTDVGQQALVDQWERTALAFGRPVDDAQYAAFQAASGRSVAYAALTAMVAGPVTALALAVLLFAVFSGVRSGTASFRQVLAIVAHAGVILLLQDIVAAPIDYARESIGGATSLVRFVASVDEGSPLARFLALVDLFVVWWLVVVAVGLSVLYRQPTRRFAALFVAIYAVVAAALAAAMALLGGT